MKINRKSIALVTFITWIVLHSTISYANESSNLTLICEGTLSEKIDDTHIRRKSEKLTLRFINKKRYFPEDNSSMDCEVWTTELIVCSQRSDRFDSRLTIDRYSGKVSLQNTFRFNAGKQHETHSFEGSCIAVSIPKF